MTRPKLLSLATAVIVLVLVSVGVAFAAPIVDWSGMPDAVQKTWEQKAAEVQEGFEKKVSQPEREASADKVAEVVAEAEAAMGSGPTVGQGDVPDYFSPWVPNWNYSPRLTKFVDSLPLLTSAGVNNLGQYLPVAQPDKTAYAGVIGGQIAEATCDYYEIAVVEYQERLHTDLPPTTLRGYVQIDTAAQPGSGIALTYPNGSAILDSGGQQVYAVDKPHYLGPVIVAQRNVPVRVKFYNYLPTGSGGDLFIPVDPTVMGAGMGAHMIMAHMPGDFMPMGTMLHIMSMEPHDLTVGSKVVLEGFEPVAYNGSFRVTAVTSATEFQIELMSDPGGPPTVVGHVMEGYTENRAVMHLHGGRTPWITDGTPHQWITPAGENTSYPQGVTVKAVPDMAAADPGDPTDGVQTYYYTNQQSARLMFYHDHVYGITRLNVYAGEAAAYMIEDQVEQSLIGAGLIPVDQIPLVIQDKTFVDAATIGDLDPTWRWGTGSDGDGNDYPDYKTGDLWVPHVYMPAQNPWDISGMAAMGRWHYGPWFWPPTNNPYGPIANPYYNPALYPWEPQEIPNIPDPGMGMEAFNDTPLVNGTAYPTLTVDPKAYRLRILNAANDRFWNLQLYEADPAVTSPEPGVGLSEVRMVPAADYSADPTWPRDFVDGNPTWPIDGRDGGVPDWKLRGPEWIQIGTESGFLPMPVVLPQRPIDWNVDVTMFNAGIVNSGSLILGPAERADVIVDFSAYAGKTLILYNDAPAAYPAGDPRYDYYTGMPDMTDTGGHFPTDPGYGPNTRTIMQIKVTDPAPVPLPMEAGWNLVAGGPGSDFGGAVLFGFNGTTYVSTTGANMVAGQGYWATFDAAATAAIVTVAAPVTVSLATGWNLIGNPTAGPVSLPTGMTCFVYTNGAYASTTTLEAGQGAWVLSETVQVIQLQGSGGAAPGFDLAALEAAWQSTDSQQGVFQRAQDPIIVAQGEATPGRDQYNLAYNRTFPSTPPNWGLSRIFDKNLTFQTVEGNIVTFPMREKAIQDEQGETFDDYGRMAGNLGVMLPNPQPGGQTFVLQEYSDPATETFTVSATPLTPPLAGDGTQLWKITHNGVDTHPIHFHLFDVQVINRVAWDNSITLPAANELGWKETVRVSPLEDTIVAMRPVIPELPFKLPDSIRPLEPILPVGATSTMFTNLDPLTGQPLAPPTTNDLHNFGWEYMWHCHILSHEEMMMMRATAVYVAPAPPSGLSGVVSGPAVALQWTNNRSIPGPMYHPEAALQLPAATNFWVERATDAAFSQNVVTFDITKDPKAAYTDQELVSYGDVLPPAGTLYYRVRAETESGYSIWSDPVSVSVAP